MEDSAKVSPHPERIAANVNSDPSGDDALIKEMRRIRDKTVTILERSDITQEARDFGERHLAKLNRWLRNVEDGRKQFTQGRLLERMRQP